MAEPIHQAEYDGCTWPVNPACAQEQWDAYDADVRERATALAALTMRRLTGYRVGGCPIKIRPCKKQCAQDVGGRSFYDYGGNHGFIAPWINRDGMWVNGCGACVSDCSCSEICEVVMPGPVGKIYEIKVDGRLLEEREWRLDDGSRLVRIQQPEPAPVSHGVLHQTRPSADSSWCDFTAQPDILAGATVDGDCLDLPATGQAIFGFSADAEVSSWEATFNGPGVGFFISNAIGVPYIFEEATLTPGVAVRTEEMDDTWVVMTLLDGGGTVSSIGATTLSDGARVHFQVMRWANGGCWPTCQDMALADTEDNTFSIRYLEGREVDGLGAYAAGVLAVEFAESCIGNACRLPDNVTSLSRQGVSMDIVSGTFPGGVTGIREVDAYIGLWNPAALRERPTIWYPGMNSARRTT